MLAQPTRATATEILVAALRVVPFDALCRHCRVIVVDTAIRGARNSYGLAVRESAVVEWAESSRLHDLDAHGHRFVPGDFREGPLPVDSMRVGMEFVPPTLAMRDSGEVYMELDFEDQSYGYAVIVSVKRRGGKWLAVVVRHMEG
jgi:hypothetical protein